MTYGYADLVEDGTILVEGEYPDYVGVTLGPDDENGTCVATGYAHTETVVTSIDLDTDETTEETRWLAYDVTESAPPGSAVGRVHAGYATAEEALMALVKKYEGKLVETGFLAEDADGNDGERYEETEGWGRSEVVSCPYLDDDEFPVVIRIPVTDEEGSLGNSIAEGIQGIMGDTHPNASRMAEVAGRRLGWRIDQFFPPLRTAGANPTVAIRAEVAVDSYGSTWLSDGDPFRAVTISVSSAVHDNRYDMHDRRSLKSHVTLEIALYEPSDDDPEPLVHVVAGGGTNCVGAISPLGIFVESGSAEVTGEGDIIRAVDEAFFKFVAEVATSLLNEPGLEAGGDG